MPAMSVGRTLRQWGEHRMRLYGHALGLLPVLAPDSQLQALMNCFLFESTLYPNLG